VTNRLLLTLGSPRESIFLNKPVDSVTVPGAEGTFTLTNNHSLVISMLKAGVITVREGTNATDYFISDGFVYLNNPKDGSGCCTAEISGVEVVPTSALDKDRAAQLISELNASAKDTEWSKVKAQLGTNLLNQVIKAAK
jgi:F-type H+-transporting ATPase subunit delta